MSGEKPRIGISINEHLKRLERAAKAKAAAEKAGTALVADQVAAAIGQKPSVMGHTIDISDRFRNDDDEPPMDGAGGSGGGGAGEIVTITDASEFVIEISGAIAVYIVMRAIWGGFSKRDTQPQAA